MPVTFECPGCGTRSTFDRLRQSAEEFCRQCDYPLFWATPLAADGPEPVAAATNGSLDPALLRRPGIAGRVAAVGANCPSCGEINVMSAEYCIRCGAPMHPLPVVEPVADPVVILAPEPAPAPAPGRAIWPFVLAGVLVLLIIIAVFVAIL